MVSSAVVGHGEGDGLGLLAGLDGLDGALGLALAVDAHGVEHVVEPDVGGDALGRLEERHGRAGQRHDLEENGN